MTFADIRESAYMAFDTVRSNKLRSSLTILGVSVGVITIVFIVASRVLNCTRAPARAARIMQGQAAEASFRVTGGGK